MKGRFRLGAGTSPQPGGERGGQVWVRTRVGTGSQISMAFCSWQGRCLNDGWVRLGG